MAESEQAVATDLAGYERLADVLNRALDQAARGKGRARHAGQLPFHAQPMQQISELLRTPDGMAFQAIKKIREGRGLEMGACVAELLGAINYIAGMVIYYEAELPIQCSTNPFSEKRTLDLQHQQRLIGDHEYLRRQIEIAQRTTLQEAPGDE